MMIQLKSKLLVGFYAAAATMALTAAARADDFNANGDDATQASYRSQDVTYAGAQDDEIAQQVDHRSQGIALAQVYVNRYPPRRIVVVERPVYVDQPVYVQQPVYVPVYVPTYVPSYTYYRPYPLYTGWPHYGYGYRSGYHYGWHDGHRR